MPCRSVCPEGPDGHPSFAACVRAAHIGTRVGEASTRYQVFDAENAAYEQAVHDGLEPENVFMADIEAAYRHADAEERVGSVVTELVGNMREDAKA